MADVHIHAPLCIAAGAILPPICAGLVCLRFYARQQQGKRFGADDWLTVPALILLVGMSASMLTGVARKSVGYPTPPIAPGKTSLTTSSYEQSTTRSVYWSIELMQIPALTATKMSILFFYRRIFNQGTDKLFGRLTFGTLIIIAIWGLGYFFSFLFICPGHPNAYWTTLLYEKEQCVNTITLHNAYGVSDVLIDFIVILLPIPVIWRLRMSVENKLAVIGVFSLGSFTIVASLFRMVTYLQSTAVEFDPKTDTDILITGGIYWSVVESGVGLMSACLPIVYGIFRAKATRNSMHNIKNNSSVKSSSSRGIWGSQFHPTAPHSRLVRLRNDSQASDIELASRGNNTAKASVDDEHHRAAPRDQILVTKTFEASKEPSMGEMV